MRCHSDYHRKAAKHNPWKRRGRVHTRLPNISPHFLRQHSKLWLQTSKTLWAGMWLAFGGSNSWDVSALCLLAVEQPLDNTCILLHYGRFTRSTKRQRRARTRTCCSSSIIRIWAASPSPSWTRFLWWHFFKVYWWGVRRGWWRCQMLPSNRI